MCNQVRVHIHTTKALVDDKCTFLHNSLSRTLSLSLTHIHMSIYPTNCLSVHLFCAFVGMGAEDFGFIAEQLPSTYFLLGIGSGTEPVTNFGLHHPCFAVDEAVMPRGVALHVNLAIRALKRLLAEEETDDSEDDEDAA